MILKLFGTSAEDIACNSRRKIAMNVISTVRDEQDIVNAKRVLVSASVKHILN